MNKLVVGNVIIDKCPTCSGIWFDKGEIETLQKAKELPNRRTIIAVVALWVYIFQFSAIPNFITTCEADSRRYSAFVHNMIRQDASPAFKDGGKMYCGPVTAANALIALQEIGEYSFTLPYSSPGSARVQLAEIFSTSEYMQTADKSGTWPGPFMGGILRFLATQGFTRSEIELLGFSALPQNLENLRKGSLISPKILSALLKNSKDLVWLHVGWYEFDAQSHTYTHSGAHYLHLVGTDGEQFLATNSSPSRRTIPLERFSLFPLPSGRINFDKAKLSLSAEGHYGLRSTPPLRGEKTAILQGVIRLRIK